MRFKAEVASLDVFSRLCSSIAKSSKTCIVKLTPDHVQFICNGNAGSSGDVQVWATFDVGTLFSFYKVESNADNEIYLQVVIEALQRAIKSAQGASEVLMRLSKKGHVPYLSLHITQASATGVRREIIQEVTARVLKPSEMSAFKEPLCPDPNVNILLPPLGNLLTVASRMGKMANVVTVAANQSGQLHLRCDTDQVTIQTDWTGLRHPKLVEEPEELSQPTDKEHFFKVALNQKSLVKFLSSYVIANTTICSICQDFCCVFYVYLGSGPDAGGVLTYFVPGMSTGQ